MTTTVQLISPCGVPVALSFDSATPQEEILTSLERAEKIGVYFLSKGWSFPQAEPSSPSAAELAQGPTFAGFPCSPTVDERGLPTWILVEGKQAQRREKQGDIWYSARTGDNAYAQVLRIPKGEKAPQVQGL